MTENFRPQIKVVQRNVEIPIKVLTAADCDPSLKPPSWSAFSGRAFEFKVPDGSEPGCNLRIPLNDTTLIIPLPAMAADGDTLRISERLDGSWRVVRKTKAFSFVVPRASAPGDQLRLHVPDGTSLLFTVPEGADPDNLVYLRHGDNGWAFDDICVLPDIDTVPPPLDWVSGPYAALLESLRCMDILRTLPLDEEGIVHMSVPFCGNFNEHRILGNFLSENILTLPGVNGVRLFCTEVVDKYSLEWAQATRWYAHTHPKIQVDLCVKDLAQDPLPDAAFTIGIHPEVTKGGYWFQIVGSILQSSANGLTVFATFFEVEMKTLLNMIDMYAGKAISVETFQNPFYDTNPKEASPALCYIVIVKGVRDSVGYSQSDPAKSE